MTNDQFGTYQTPSARPPEPPYRGGDAASMPHSYSQTTERQEPASQTAAPQQPAYQQPAHQAPVRQEPAYQAAPQQPAYQAPAYQAAPPRSHQREAGAPRKSGGGGRSFFFGFLGALVACALCLGGFAAWSHFNAKATSASALTGTSDSTVINAVEEGQTLPEAVAAKALPSVVAVYNYQQAQSSAYGYGYGANNGGSSNALQAAGMGSGVLISDQGYILTNYHVVEGASKLTVKVGEEERDATFVGGDESSDVAVVKVEDTSNLTVADIGDSDNLVIGEWVMTVGAPLGLEQSVATGVVSAVNRSNVMSDSSSNGYTYYGTQANDYTYYPNMIQTDAVINPGNSGGALVDSNGKLIGINTMISSLSGDYAGVGFAIPINYAMGIAEQVIAGKEPTHAMLGVSISSVNSSNAQRYGLSVQKGAYIASIAEGTGAAKSDLKEGDIITAIDGKSVESATDVTLDVRAHNPGDTVTVTVNRNGETLEIPVVLSSDEGMSSSSKDQNQNQGQDQGQGNGRSQGYTDEELQELLKMLGF